MYAHSEKLKDKNWRGTANALNVTQLQRKQPYQFVDSRPEAVDQRRIQVIADNSTLVSSLRAVQDMADTSPKYSQSVQMKYNDSNRHNFSQLNNDVKTSSLHEKAQSIAQLKPVIQLQKDSTTFGASVYGDDALIDVFEELMANDAFKKEVADDYIKDNKFLELTFFDNHSRFSGRKIYINEEYRGDTTKIRHDLAFELHNATSGGTKSELMESNDVPQNNRNNTEKIKNARITEYTEWLNILKLGIKYEDPTTSNMGFESEPQLVQNFKTHYYSFEKYLEYQLKGGHTQLYLENVQSETKANTALNLSNRNPEYYRTNIPELFTVKSGEPQTLEGVIQNLGNDSDLKKAIVKGKTLESRKKYIQDALIELYNVFKGTEKESIADSIIGRLDRVSKEIDLNNKSVFIKFNIQLLSLKHDLPEKVQEQFDKENDMGILSGIFRGFSGLV